MSKTKQNPDWWKCKPLPVGWESLSYKERVDLCRTLHEQLERIKSKLAYANQVNSTLPPVEAVKFNERQRPVIEQAQKIRRQINEVTKSLSRP